MLWPVVGEVEERRKYRRRRGFGEKRRRSEAYRSRLAISNVVNPLTVSIYCLADDSLYYQ